MPKKKAGQMLTASQVAKRLAVGESSVRMWARQGKIKGAHLVESPVGSYWMIPEDSLLHIVVRGRGRPPKPKPPKGSPK